MVFNIKYNPASNVKFVKCMEKYPILYKNTNLPKSQKEKMWEEVAQELDSSVWFCKDRWTNLRGCYKRYLRHKAEKTMKRPYYLAEHMEFVRPYINIKLGSRIQNGADIHSDPEDEDIDKINVEDINLMNHSVKMEVCNDFPLNPVCVLIDSSDGEETVFHSPTGFDPAGQVASSEGSVISSKHEDNNNETDNDEDESADFCFFKSLLPDIRLMTSQQQLRFRKALLNAIDMTLYGKDLKNVLLVKSEVE